MQFWANIVRFSHFGVDDVIANLIMMKFVETMRGMMTKYIPTRRAKLVNGKAKTNICVWLFG